MYPCNLGAVLHHFENGRLTALPRTVYTLVSGRQIRYDYIMNVAPFAITPITYDRVEVLTFADGTEGKHCSTEVCFSGGNLPQPAKSYVKSWQDINPSITGVRFEYINPRCSNFIRG